MASKAVENRLRSLADVKKEAAEITLRRFSREVQEEVLEKRAARAKAKAAKGSQAKRKAEKEEKAKVKVEDAAKAAKDGEGKK